MTALINKEVSRSLLVYFLSFLSSCLACGHDVWRFSSHLETVKKKPRDSVILRNNASRHLPPNLLAVRERKKTLYLLARFSVISN